MALTDKQELFVQEAIRTDNQREAYRKAYPSSKKWKDKNVDTAASRLLNSAKVLPRYTELRERLRKEAEDEVIVDAKSVLKELKAIAFANATDFVRVNTVENTGLDGKQHTGAVVEVTPTKDVPPDKLAAIAAIKQGKSGIEIKTRDKIRALELLGKHLGLFTEQTPGKDIEGEPDPLSSALEGIAQELNNDK